MNGKRYLRHIPESLLDNNGNKQYAITTLLMINDNYLPGCVAFAYSVKMANKKLRNEIDLICMVTKDISQLAIDDLKLYYDRVELVDIIEMNMDKMNHSKEDVKNIYAKAFTKINCLKFIEYKKVLQMDVDMLVIKEEFFSIFNLNTPACPFVGCLVFYKKDILDYYNMIYNNYLTHGGLIPKKLYDIDCKKLYKKYHINNMGFIGVESTIIMLKPSITDYNNMIEIINNGSGIYKSESNLFTSYYKYKFHHIDINFVGRWETPEDNKKLVVIDMYGSSAKPWNIDKYNELYIYKEVKYWGKIFVKYYNNSFKNKCKHMSIINLGEFLQERILN